MDEPDASDLSRRAFIQRAAMGAMALDLMPALGSGGPLRPLSDGLSSTAGAYMPADVLSVSPNMIGAYGPWAAGVAEEPPTLSFRRGGWESVQAWSAAGRERLLARLAQPENLGLPAVTVRRRYVYDGLEVEELSWQLPYGPPTEATLLKPAGARGRLPAVLGLHCHSGTKYFGREKIARTADEVHPLMARLHERNYEGRPWANELARRGYVVLVPDAFAFGSRRVRLADVPEKIRGGLPIEEPDSEAEIQAYDRWAGAHEHIMAKSLFSAGTTWPGVFLSDDQRALDVLCARDDVDPARVGCAGLSGGGLRTVFLGGADPRIKCAVCVGMMTTWTDYLLHKSETHTWMVYVPLLPRELDYPEILGLRAPLPTMVLSNLDDPLFTRDEMAAADRILRAMYDKAGAGERYSFAFHPGGHKFDRRMQDEAFAWLGRWL